MCMRQVVHCVVLMLCLVQESDLSEHVDIHRALSSLAASTTTAAVFAARVESAVELPGGPSTFEIVSASSVDDHLHRLEPSTPVRESMKDVMRTPHLTTGTVLSHVAFVTPSSPVSLPEVLISSTEFFEATLTLYSHSKLHPRRTLVNSKRKFRSDQTKTASVTIETSLLRDISTSISTSNNKSTDISMPTTHWTPDNSMTRKFGPYSKEFSSSSGELLAPSATRGSDGLQITPSLLGFKSSGLLDRIDKKGADFETHRPELPMTAGRKEERFGVSPTKQSTLGTASMASKPSTIYKLPPASSGQPFHNSYRATFRPTESFLSTVDDSSRFKSSIEGRRTSAVAMETISRSAYFSTGIENNNAMENGAFSLTRGNTLYPTSSYMIQSTETQIKSLRRKSKYLSQTEEVATDTRWPQNDAILLSRATQAIVMETVTPEGINHVTATTVAPTVFFSGLDFRDMVVIYIVSAMVGSCFFVALLLRIYNRVKKNRRRKTIEKRNQQRESAKKKNTGSMMRTTNLLAKETSRSVPKPEPQGHHRRPKTRNLTLEALIEIGALTNATLGVTCSPENETELAADAPLVKKQAIFEENAYENPALRYGSDEEICGKAEMELESSDNDSFLGLTKNRSKKKRHFVKPQYPRCTGKRTDSRDSGYIENFASSDSLRMKVLARAISSEGKRRKSVNRSSDMTPAQNDADDDFMNEISSCPCDCQESTVRGKLERSRSNSLPNIDICSEANGDWTTGQSHSHTATVETDSKDDIETTECEWSVDEDTVSESDEDFALPTCNCNDFRTLDEEETPPPSPVKRSPSDDISSDESSALNYDMNCVRLAIKRYSIEDRPPTPLRRAHAIDIADSDHWRRDSLNYPSHNFIPLEGIKVDFLGPVYLTDLQSEENDSPWPSWKEDSATRHDDGKSERPIIIGEHTIVNIAEM
ncbi:uncharacterized protein [Ptychodera flava]|uniref:uncharacterized protein n=1 Tax=Ptychodera flava TaxID=63121 RepID=UPI003969ECBA